jgi:hypothetical protein
MPVLASNETNGRIVTDRGVGGEVFRSMPKTRLIEPARFVRLSRSNDIDHAGGRVLLAYLTFLTTSKRAGDAKYHSKYDAK